MKSQTARQYTKSGLEREKCTTKLLIGKNKLRVFIFFDTLVRGKNKTRAENTA